MKINRNLAIASAISLLVIAGLLANQFAGKTEVQSPTAKPASTEAPVSPSVSASPTEESSAQPAQSNPSQPSTNLTPGNIWTYDCEIPVQLPESFYLTCADGGWYVHNIKWQTWSANEAKATATFSENVCDPDCADGYRVETPVKITLTTFAKPGKKIYLSNLEMRASTSKSFENGDRTLTWDLSEFAKMMDSN